MRFTKMHGIGNDYVYVSLFDQPAPRDPAKLAVAIANRHRGVGGDGLILIEPSKRADARMRMFNADGSEAEMCGNGLRCVAKFIYDHGIAPKPRLCIETGRGILTLDIEVQGGKARRVRVDMGRPILEPKRIPAHFPGDRVVDAILPDCDDPTGATWTGDASHELRVTCVSMGNPHAVFFTADVSSVPLARLGPELEHHPLFPQRINVHYAQVLSPREIRMRTWERGSGETLACGTGACAVGVAGVLTGRTERKILAHLPGGDLEIEWPGDDSSVFMTGPAVEVFSGEWPDG